MNKNRIIKTCVCLVVSGVSLILVGAYILLRESLPLLSGELHTHGITSTTVIERDAFGIPTIHASNRLDISYATGFVHAQDRFFQMDLMRRAAAGELSELFGADAVSFDQQRRIHQFRKHSQLIFDHLSTEEKEILRSYANGVNAGLASLTVRPFEYLLLLTHPTLWKSQDSILVCLGLFFELQDSNGNVDLAHGYMNEFLPHSVYNFFAKNGSTWEASLDGSVTPILSIPNANEFSYLKKYDAMRSETSPVITTVGHTGGSNCWAITGNRTANGKALLACDMHLQLSVPNIWYRAAFEYPGKNGDINKIVGATLPGAPCMIIGSNGHISWGFTNAYVDTTDLIIIKHDDNNPNHYITVNGPLEFENVSEIINIKDEKPILFKITKTVWGPLSSHNFFNSPIAIQWIAHQPDAINMRLIDLESVHSSEEALESIKRIKIPILNFIVADKDGHIGWSYIGSMPNRIGFDGTKPVSNEDGKKSWHGSRDPKEYPSILDPHQESLWSANNRSIGSDHDKLLNQEGYLNGIRAWQIKNTLLQGNKLDHQHMLALQLDTKALFFERWQKFLLNLLQKDFTSPQSLQLAHVIKAWNKHASTDSAGYYWIRRFRDITTQSLIARFLNPCFNAWEDFHKVYQDFEEPIWLLINQQPDYLINPEFGSWDNELLAYVHKMLDQDLPITKSIADSTWGKQTVLKMQHPFSFGMPFLQPFLDMPQECLPGDFYVPRVTSSNDGASQRMVVSPGNEDMGIFHSPGGQCGHPLSSYYRKGHELWVNGTPSAFLPEKTCNTLMLIP